MDKKNFFRSRLMSWLHKINRPLPWKGEQDPYKIWLSEIILQQTRVEQGTPYYLKFIERFPHVSDLARAPEAEVLKLWEGLGYYTRARNLHAAAQYIDQALGGRFPDAYADIRNLKGVGDYTAAAIASFAFGLPYAVVDGNVFRVLARFFGLDLPTDTTAGKSAFRALAQELLDPNLPGSYNQAIMDFGALQCTPAKPQCASCPLADHCSAKAENTVLQLPVKSKARAKRERLLLYGVFDLPDAGVLIRRRTGKDIWRNLYEFPGIEIAPQSESGSDAGSWAALLWNGNPPQGVVPKSVSKTYKQVLTHQIVHAVFIRFQVEKKAEKTLFESNLGQNCIEIPQVKLKKIYPVPRIIDWYWQEKDVSLSLF